MRVRSCASPWWEASPRRSITPFTSCWCGVSTTSGRPLPIFAAFCVSIVCNFLLSSYFTFRVRPSARRAVRFLTAHLINLVNELVLLEIWLWAGVPKLYAPLCVFLVAFPVNFLMVRFALRGRLKS